MSEGSPKILLVIGGGIAAYKACELVRMIRRQGGSVTCVLTEGGSQFVTPMTLAALSENPVYTSLWDLKRESEMGHIELSREADLIVVCPATADLLAKMSAGIADDLATTLLLATDKPVVVVPAMNVRMWEHAVTQRNVERLREAGVGVIDPGEGPMACGEFGAGRLPEPVDIWNSLADQFGYPHSDETPMLPPAAPQPAPVPALPKVAQDAPEALVEEDEDEGFEVEFDEEEPEEEESHGGGLGGLLSSLIRRNKPVEPDRGDEPDHDPDPGFGMLDEDDAEWEDLPEPEIEEEDYDPHALPPGFAASGDDGGPLGGLVVTKGKARSAPPTDAAAINHLVQTGAGDQAPQPLPGEEGFYNPLEGQGTFDTDPAHRPLFGKHIVVTAGPTREAIDPVRFLSNRSSGKQGFAIAAAAAAAGARVTLVAGPVSLPTPLGVDRIDVESAVEMKDAVKQALPADAAVMVAAVADWRAKTIHDSKIKKHSAAPPALILEENPDILAWLATSPDKPPLLVGFAAETDAVLDNAKAKRKRKGADWIVANDVSDAGGAMDGDDNAVTIVTSESVERLERMPKGAVGRELVARIAQALGAPAEIEA
ncbi:MAG: bifunctional phosphopantothenoylcysteine decarboxylase/phosphopantothenate synthase [Sphingomonadaceae bacterium]